MDKVFLTDYPIPRIKTNEILDLIHEGEYVTTLWMPHSGRTDFAIQLANKVDLLPERWSEVEFYVLDASLDSPYLEKRFEEIKAKARAWIATGGRAVIILDSFSLEKASFIKYVFSFRHELPPNRLTFLLLAFESEFTGKTQKTDMSMIYHNIIKVPYFTKEETFAWLEDTPDKEKIYGFCGGVFGLLINFKRALRVSKNLEEAKTCEMMRQTLEHLWGRFSERERLILKALAQGNHLPPYSYEINYMKQHGLITADNKLVGSWPQILVDQDAPVRLEKTAGAVLYNGTNLLALFTPMEEKVFLDLLKKNSLTREEVADLLWGSEAADKYSDWAIDQTISRLRRKLQTAGIAGDKIKTLKGQGFKLQNLSLHTPGV